MWNNLPTGTVSARSVPNSTTRARTGPRAGTDRTRQSPPTCRRPAQTQRTLSGHTHSNSAVRTGVWEFANWSSVHSRPRISIKCAVVYVHVRTSTLVIPSTRRTKLGDRAFPVTAARAWNALPSSVRSAPSLLQFRRDLKTALHVSVIVLFTIVSSCVTDCNF